MGQSRFIGAENKLLWHLAPDLKRFKDLTMGKPMIMGRKTFESLPGLLPNRTHIVISRKKKVNQEWVKYVSSFKEAVQYASNIFPHEIMVIGGGAIYELALPFAEKVYLTEVDFPVPEHAEAKVFFPVIGKEFKKIEEYNLDFYDYPHDNFIYDIDFSTPEDIESKDYFPPMDSNAWEIVEELGPYKDEKSGLEYSYKTYMRIGIPAPLM